MAYQRRSLALLLTLALSACGGGGGGGQSVPPPLRITDANAQQAARLVFIGIESIALTSDLLLIASRIFVQFGINPLPLACTGGGTAEIRYLDNDGSNTLSPGDVVRFSQDGCNGADGEVTLTITSLVGAMDSLAGEVRIDTTFAGGESYRGRLTLEVAASSSVQTLTLSAITFEVTTPSEAESFAIALFEGTETSAGDYSYRFDGRLDSSTLGGALSFATETALDGSFGELPRQGAMVLTAGSTRARFAAAADPTHAPQDVEIRIDAGDGQFGAPRHADWFSVIEGALFGVSPPRPPTIREFSLEPAEPTTAETLMVSAQALDSNGDYLTYTYVWRRNGEVIAGQSGPTLPAGVHKKGDLIEVTLTVSDGRFDVTASAQVTVRNAVPIITNLTLTPAAPYTNDDLRVQAEFSDADGDPLDVRHAWERNGVLVTSVTSEVFAASLQRRDDVISVRVSADDGDVETAEDASVTILDSPPLVAVLSSPSTVTYGIPTSFQAEVSDADDDPLDRLAFIIDYGPAGMTVDAATGVVAWTPNGPLFDRSTAMHWGVTVSDPMANVVSGTMLVVDPLREYPLARTGVEAPSWPGGVRIADFDADGDHEMLVLGERALYELAWTGTSYAQSWMYPFAFAGAQRGEAMATGDVDGDGLHEIFVAAGQEIARLDGGGRRVVATTSLEWPRRCTQLEVADVNADGALELVCLTHYGSDSYPTWLTILRAETFEQLAQRDIRIGADTTMLALGNVDADPRLELVTSNGDVYDGGTLVDDWPTAPRLGLSVGVGDVDEDGVAEILGLDRDGVLKVYRPGNATPIATLEGVQYGSVLVYNVDGDPRAEILVGVGASGEVRIYGYESTSATLVLEDVITAPSSFGLAQLSAGDLDGDADSEIVWSSGMDHAILIADAGPTPAIEWTYTDPWFLNGPMVGGELANLAGEPALVFAIAMTDRGYGDSRLLALSPTTGELAISEGLGFNATYSAGVTIADFDLDGTDEALLATAEFYSNYLTAYDLAARLTEWESPRELGQITAVASADFNGDARAELVALAGNGKLYVFDIYADDLLWETDVPLWGRALATGDLDGDGVHEILVATYTDVAAYSRVVGGGAPFARTALFTSGTRVSDVVSGDADGDGELEIFVLGAPEIGGAPTFVHRLDSTLTLRGTFTIPVEAHSAYIEELGFPRRNLIVPTSGFAGGDSYVIAFDADSGREIWRSPKLPGYVAPDSLHFVDVGATGDVRIALGTDWAMLLTR